uniref:C3H1-type domain-containing protein n=1 Tax=Meloidogyne hapla TaxID=6305 RepID=A0A1I8BBP2_MELHA
MIRSRPGGGPFSRSRCPFDDEGEQCKRPFCPFFHPFSGDQYPCGYLGYVASNPPAEINDLVSPSVCGQSDTVSFTHY